MELTDTDGKRINTKQHIVIERVFNWFPGCRDLEVNHKNGIRNDNRISNLEIVTHLENMHHAYATGLNKNYGENNPFATATEEQARKICELLSNGDKRTYAEIGDEVGVSELVVVQIATGRTWRRVSEEYNMTYEKRNSRFTEEDVHEMCKIFVQCKGMDFIDIIHIVAEEMNYEYCDNFRHKMRFIYFKRPGYFTRVTNKYDYVPPRYQSQMLS